MRLIFGSGASVAARAMRWQAVAARRWAPLLWAICLVALLARTGAVLLLPQPIESDAQQYLCMARNLVELATLQDCDDNFAYYSVGYPLLLALPFWLLGAKLWVAYAVNLVLGSLSVLLAGLVARELTRSPFIGLCAAAFLALYIEALLYAGYLLKENLVIPILLLQFWLVLRARAKRPSVPILALFGASVALQALTGVTSLAALPALAAYRLWRSPGRVALMRDAIWIAAVAALCLAPWLLRNERVVGAPVLNTNGGVNLYVGNNDAAGLFFMKIWDTPIGHSWHALHDREGGELESDRTLRGLAIDHIRTHPRETAQLWTERFLAFWSPPYQKIADPTTGMAERLTRVAWLAQYLLLLGLALLPAILRPRALPQLGLLYGTMLLCAAAYAPFFIIYRFRLPVMVLACIAAAWGAGLLLQALARAGTVAGAHPQASEGATGTAASQVSD